ncbi:MAG: M28 family peptidase [Cyanobacteria bacterium J06598_3]
MATPAEITKALIIKQLNQHLQALVGPRDPYLGEGRHQLTQQYIRTEFARWGTPTSQRLTTQGRSSSSYNWQLTIPGKQPQLAPILVGAHYDTVPGSPGADDNASGVAVLLVLAELLSSARPQTTKGQITIEQTTSEQTTKPQATKGQAIREHISFEPQRPIHLVAFDLEEYGLVGSRTCVEKLRSQNAPLHLMLSLEMLGYFTSEPNSQGYPLAALSRLYPSTGDFIALVGNLGTIPKMMSLKRQFKKAGVPCQWLPVPNHGKQIPRVRDSDHSPFWDAGYPAIMVTDTANLRNPHYHSATDTLGTLNVEMMANVAQGLARGLSRL